VVLVAAVLPHPATRAPERARTAERGKRIEGIS
jgi:hypothetical protein